ncbi:hypothetical protein [Erythrobacter sp. SG61-1L]|uniref:hypothetical protein n=1 Tax=Erythrobacter sp. SG61-1L TaxID=1603897 RepID=UPI0006C93311|nr:hypothetical protein [Erythrobacter sp. SG61-1L]
MRRLVIVLAATALSLPGGLAMAKPSAAGEGEAQLQEMIAGRVAGEPTHCLTVTGKDNLKVIDRTAVVFEVGDTIYVGRPLNPDHLRRDNTLTLSRQSGASLCATDTIVAVNLDSRARTQVLLREFVPYTKAQS